jgi:hypothetical protein
MPVVAVDANSPPFEQGSKQARPTQSSPTECDIAKSGVCLGFVEVDDMGAMFDAGELQAVLKTIERANMLAGQSPDAAPMVVCFVHGWNHNASETDSNVAGFKEMLERLWSHYGGRRKVIGVSARQAVVAVGDAALIFRSRGGGSTDSGGLTVGRVRRDCAAHP